MHTNNINASFNNVHLVNEYCDVLPKDVHGLPPN